MSSFIEPIKRKHSVGYSRSEEDLRKERIFQMERIKYHVKLREKPICLRLLQTKRVLNVCSVVPFFFQQVLLSQFSPTSQIFPIIQLPHTVLPPRYEKLPTASFWTATCGAPQGSITHCEEHATHLMHKLIGVHDWWHYDW